jgi:hypothetical protein
LQHERLIHLIVTAVVGIILIMIFCSSSIYWKLYALHSVGRNYCKRDILYQTLLLNGKWSTKNV